MIAHQLRSMGAVVIVIDTADYDSRLHPCDVLVLGPGPGDPADMAHPVMGRLQGIIAEAQDTTTPMLGICLGHQALAVAAGLDVTRQGRSTQGLQIETAIGGTPHRLGFYNSFSPVMNEAAQAQNLELDVDNEGRIVAMRRAGHRRLPVPPRIGDVRNRIRPAAGCGAGAEQITVSGSKPPPWRVSLQTTHQDLS